MRTPRFCALWFAGIAYVAWLCPPLGASVASAKGSPSGSIGTKSSSGDRMLGQLIARHYDPTRDGLERLSFTLVFRESRAQLRVEAKGSWRAKGVPKISAIKVWRKGKRRPRNKHSEQLFTSVRYRLRRLMRGIGRGFLSERLSQWRNKRLEAHEGSAGSLALQFRDEAGLTTLEIDRKRKQLLRVVQRSSKGVTRTMRYQYRAIDGHNLVKWAELRVAISGKSTIPLKARQLLQLGDRSTFSLRYKKVGRFWLPSRLERTLPRAGSTLSLALRYTSPRPK